MAGTARVTRQIMEVLVSGNVLPSFTYGTTRATRQITEVLISGGNALPPYLYGTTRATRQVIEILTAEPYYDLDGSNTLVLGQIASPLVDAAAPEYEKPMVVKSGTIQKLTDVDVVNHGDFPLWDTNSLAWTQTR
ncbi:MAG: hypothetical protein WC919_07575, partial [Candidatus Paceibacterota bacterium]